LGLFRAWGERSRKLRLLAFVCTGLTIIGATLAFSRGAMVGFLLLIMIMVFMRYIKIQQVVVILLGILLLVLAFPQINTRFSSLGALFSSQDEGGLRSADGAIQGRATEMLVALYVFLDHPIIGVGPGMIGYEMAEYSKQISLRTILTTREAHNMYLGEAADTGILGLATLMTILIYTLYQLAKSRTYWLQKGQENLANMSTGFFLAVITYMTTGIFLHMSYVRYFWLIIALAVVASEFRESDLTEEELADLPSLETVSLAENPS
jgi:O-antigen ligase